ncbi:MAG: hypothetical protein JWM74_298 [Myxococcaceae bacterium]|nr:hypothetical protein [Myxococcaceae bacterium]
MIQTAVVRLAMQTGASCAWSIARAYLCAWPPITLVTWILFFGGDGAWGSAVTTGLVATVPLFFAALHVWVARMTRPSDVVLSADGAHFEGGLHHGVLAPWGKITSVQTERLLAWNFKVWLDSREREDPDEEEKRQERLKNPETDLQLSLCMGKETLVLAQGELPIEERSLRTLRDVLDRRRHPGAKRVAAEQPSLHTLACTSCGAMVTPVAEETTPCGSCSRAVTMPEDIRTRVAHAQAIERTGRALGPTVRDVLAQSRAVQVNRFFAAVCVVLLLSVILECSFIGFSGTAGVHLGLSGLFLALCPAALLAACYFAMRMHVATRAAALVLTLDYGAISSDVPGEPFRCRACGAPLPKLIDPIVVRCMYCEADNLLDLDLGERRQKQESDVHHLDVVLARRRRERSFWFLRTAVATTALVALVAGAFFTHR